MSTKLKVALLALVLVIVAAGGGIWWYLRDDAPAEVSIGDAVAAASDDDDDDGATATTTAGSTATTTAGSNTDADGVEGTWTIDPSRGEFDFDTATGSFAGFRIEEELAGIGSTTAVGRTGDVDGTITIDGTTLTAAEFSIDVSTITTNDSRRNSRVQDALETSQFPEATFTLTEPVELPAGADEGGTIAVTADGELTIHGVTRQVAFPLEAQLVDDTVAVVGSLDVVFSDYDVEVPDSQVVLSVEDHGTLELQFLMIRS